MKIGRQRCQRRLTQKDEEEEGRRVEHGVDGFQSSYKWLLIVEREGSEAAVMTLCTQATVNSSESIEFNRDQRREPKTAW